MSSMILLVVALGITSGPLVSILTALFVLPAVVLISYDVGCLVTGQCRVWSWIVTVWYSLYYVIAGVGGGIALFLATKKK